MRLLEKVVSGRGVPYMFNELLQQAGLSNDSYIGMATLQPLKSIISVYYRQADAAGVGDGVLKFPRTRKKIDVSKLRILAKTKASPKPPISAS